MVPQQRENTLGIIGILRPAVPPHLIMRTPLLSSAPLELPSHGWVRSNTLSPMKRQGSRGEYSHSSNG